jgi:DNA mismatch repair protein MutL
MPIRRLPPETVNRIAAGEVVERPASAVKELVENALDAGARRVEVEADGGGLTRILVADDGSGLSPDELSLAVERHATSKLSPDADGTWDLLHISTLGFRGEALPSIGSVARLSISSRARGAADAHAILVEGGATGDVGPSAFAGAHGARVEVRDLFYATPARLKFMKSARAEQMAIAEELKRQAMAHEAVAFTLDLDGRRVLRLSAEHPGPEGRLARLAAVLGNEFQDNALAIESEREGIRLTGFAGLPTYSRGNAAHQYLFVNGRPVRDRLLQGALRGAYADLSGPRPPSDGGAVHRARPDPGRRQRPSGQGRGALPRPVAGPRPDHRRPAPRPGRRRPPSLDHRRVRGPGRLPGAELSGRRPSGAGFSAWQQGGWTPRTPAPSLPGMAEATARVEPMGDWTPAPQAWGEAAPVIDPVDYPLGAARAQVHETYMVAQTRDGIVIVDQHAAHERLVYERMKTEMESDGGVVRQTLLLPEVVDLDPAEADRVMAGR